MTSPHDLLSLSGAVQRMGMRKEDAQAWLRSRRLIRRVAGRQRVIWGDVLDAIRRDSPSPADDPMQGAPQRRGVEARRRWKMTDAF